MRSRASSFKWEYHVLSPRSSSNCLRLLPRLLVTSIRPCIFPSITCFRRQFLRKICPIQLAFRFLISCRIFLCSLTLSNTSSSFRFQLWALLLAVFSLCVLFSERWLALPQPWRVSFNFWTWIEPGLCNWILQLCFPCLSWFPQVTTRVWLEICKVISYLTH
jgi:hypothetical protein